MPKYEYDNFKTENKCNNVSDHEGNLLKLLNKLGLENWRFVEKTFINTGQYDNGGYYRILMERVTEQ